MPANYSQPLASKSGFLKVVELFDTVQGEGKYAGVSSVFLRTGACNLTCPGCDTVWDRWKETPYPEIADTILGWKSGHLVLTGGEPTLWQPQLDQFLQVLDLKLDGEMERGYHVVTVETNGAVPIKNDHLLDRIDLWSFSPKVGSLGRDEFFRWDVVFQNLDDTRGRNQLKYVLDPSNAEDVDRIFKFHQTAQQCVADEFVYFQPYDTETLVNIQHAPGLDDVQNYLRRLSALTKLVAERSEGRFRVMPQLHKLLAWR